jgi:SAM-dependent methyltransferase
MDLSIFRLIGQLKRTLWSAKKRQWKDLEYFDSAWKDRIQLMAGYIPGHSGTILDIGCGKMWLKEYLPAGCAYYGLDYIYRGLDSHVFDLNKHEFPVASFDITFVSGCLEYITDYKWLISKISDQSAICILSYCTFDIFNSHEKRTALGWVNHLTELELINVFNTNKMYATAKDKTSTSNTIYVFSK